MDFLVSQIAANEVDAVRKTFNVQVLRIQKGRGGFFNAADSLNHIAS